MGLFRQNLWWETSTLSASQEHPLRSPLLQGPDDIWSMYHIYLKMVSSWICNQNCSFLLEIELELKKIMQSNNTVELFRCHCLPMLRVWDKEEPIQQNFYWSQVFLSKWFHQSLFKNKVEQNNSGVRYGNFNIQKMCEVLFGVVNQLTVCYVTICPYNNVSLIIM